MTIGIRKRVYPDRSLDQLARDADGSLRELAAKMPALELKPAEETKTGFTWGGKPVWAKNFSGVMPASGIEAVLTGVDEIIAVFGWASVLGAPVTPPIVGDQGVAVVVGSEGSVTIGNQGTLFDGGRYSLTLWYTRRGTNG